MTNIAYRWFDAFETEGQRYERIGERSYTRKRDGQQTTLAVWQSHCVDCGAAFTVDGSHKPVPVRVTRRCRACIDANRATVEANRQDGLKPVYRTSGRFPSPSAPFVPAYDAATETGHAAPRTEAPAGSPAVLQGAPAANVAPAVRLSKGRQRGAVASKPSAFTDR
jgi:hypothetical protein